MTMAIGHFAVGVSGTMVIFHMLPLRIRLKVRFAQMFIIIVGGLWAMLPDIVQYTNVLYYINKYWTKIALFENTRFSDLTGFITGFINRLNAFHHSQWANINYFHQFMDVTDKNDSIVVSGLLVFIMLGVVLFLSFREFRERRSRRS